MRWKHVVLTTFVVLYWLVVGHGHTWVFAALMLAAIANDVKGET